jgi:Protein of unknown function (DUF3999)
MKTLLALSLAALLATSATAQTPLRPEDFAYRSVVSLSGAGPFHQVALPLGVYEGVTSADLADLRVFNGQGEVLPYALLRSESQTVSRQIENTAPFFPLPTPGKDSLGAGDISVTVRQTADGSLVSVRQPAAKAEPGGIIAGVVIDASTVKGSVRSLRLITGASATPFNSFTIESSQDLQHWQVLKHDAQLVHLEHAGRRVDRDAVEWDSAAARYLRLLWDDPQRAPEIKSVSLGTVETSFNPPVRIWTAGMEPSAIQPGIYEYAWAGQMPLEKLRIDLPQVNTLAPLTIEYLPEKQRKTPRLGWHRHHEEQRWEELAQTVAYRLQAPQGEVKSADVTLDGAAANRLRLVMDARSGGIGNKPPILQIGFVPHVLVFLARGDGPFVLAWGASGVAPGALPLPALMPGYDGAASLKAATASLLPLGIVQGRPAAPAGRAVAEASSSSTKWVLWAVLLGGLLVLGGMARSLIQQLRQPPKAKP